MKHSLGVMIAEVEREIRMRHQVYPRRVLKKTMRQSEADELIAIMVSVSETLKALQAAGVGDERA